MLTSSSSPPLSSTVAQPTIRPSISATSTSSPRRRCDPARAPQASTRRGRANRCLLRIQRLRREGRRSSTPTRFREHLPWSLGGHEYRRPLPRSTGYLFLSSPGPSWCHTRGVGNKMQHGPCTGRPLLPRSALWTVADLLADVSRITRRRTRCHRTLPPPATALATTNLPPHLPPHLSPHCVAELSRI